MLSMTVLVGGLIVDPKLRHTTSGITVTSFTITVDRFCVKSGAERQTDFIDIVAWHSIAEFICKYFRKGQLITVQGSVQTRNYQDKDGNKRKAFEIVTDSVHFAESKHEGGAPSPEYGSYSRSGAPMPSAPAYTSGNTGDFEEIPIGDNLPF